MPAPGARPRVADIVAAVAARHGVDAAAITRKCRVPRIVAARDEAATRIRAATGLSDRRVGELLGGHDGTSMHAARRRHAQRCVTQSGQCGPVPDPSPPCQNRGPGHGGSQHEGSDDGDGGRDRTPGHTPGATAGGAAPGDARGDGRPMPTRRGRTQARLLPCPFCGAAEPAPAACGVYILECTRCGATGPEAYSRDQARAAWNARGTVPTAIRDWLAELATDLTDAAETLRAAARGDAP